MKFKRLILSFVLIIGACDDPSLDRPAPILEPVEPINELTQLSQITVTDAVDASLLTQIDLIYDQNNLVSEINFTGQTDTQYEFTYAANDRLTAYRKAEAGQTIDYLLEYVENTIELSSTDDPSTTTRTFYIDNQNRISRAVEHVNNNVTEDLRYQYSANFNVERINNLNANNSLINYSLLTYTFNNNPFTDMNDLIKFIVFEDFIPYSRFLPTSQEMYVVDSRGDLLTRNISYTYELRPDDFPSSRAVSEQITGGNIENTIETFIYR